MSAEESLRSLRTEPKAAVAPRMGKGPGVAEVGGAGGAATRTSMVSPVPSRVQVPRSPVVVKPRPARVDIPKVEELMMGPPV